MTDRNRTSPFAFTGNKFEFRAQGSSANIALANTALNAITAESFDYMATQLEKAVKEGKDFNAALGDLLKKTLGEHKRICFDGNNYAAEWHTEAEKRGLRNSKNSPEALKAWTEPATIELFKKYGVLDERESHSRAEICYERYNKVLNIEAYMTLEMGRNMILPAGLKYQRSIADTLNASKSAAPKGDYKAQEGSIEKVAALNSGLIGKLDALQDAVSKAVGASSVHEAAGSYLNNVIPAMQAVRDVADQLELVVDDGEWPLPKYREMLFIY